MVALATEFASPRKSPAAEKRSRGRVQLPGLRYYNPTLGRWVNRDPIGELGGVALMTFLANTPVDATDSLGLSASGQLHGCEYFKKLSLKKYASGDPTIRKKAAHMRNSCGFKGKIKTKCSCKGDCDGATNGYFDHPRTIVLCANKFRSRDDWEEIWRHEFSHLFDAACGAGSSCKPNSSGYRQDVCSEIRAYEGDPSVPADELIARAADSVAASCCQGSATECEPGIGSKWQKAWDRAHAVAGDIRSQCTGLDPLDPLPSLPPSQPGR